MREEGCSLSPYFLKFSERSVVISLLIMTADITRRPTVFLWFAVTLLFYSCGPPPPAPVRETLPASLTDQEFWTMITGFSEPGGYDTGGFVCLEWRVVWSFWGDSASRHNCRSGPHPQTKSYGMVAFVEPEYVPCAELDVLGFKGPTIAFLGAPFSSSRYSRIRE